MKIYGDILNGIQSVFKNDFNTISYDINQIKNSPGNIKFPALFLESDGFKWQAGDADMLEAIANLTFTIATPSINDDTAFFALGEKVVTTLYDKGLQKNDGSIICERFYLTESNAPEVSGSTKTIKITMQSKFLQGSPTAPKTTIKTNIAPAISIKND